MTKTKKVSNERGVVLIVALIAIVIMAALGTALMLITATESKIAGNFRLAFEAAYAADAVLERALDDMEAVHDWSTVLNGSVQSAFVDGPASGLRTLADGNTIDLSEVVNVANCQKTSPCSEDDFNRVTDERPWGLDNPRWQPFAWGPLNKLTASGSIDSPFYVLALVGDDPSECDNNPLADGGAPVQPCGGALAFNPGTGVLSLRAEAFGPYGTHKVIDVTVTRTDGRAAVRMLSWREVREVQ